MNSSIKILGLDEALNKITDNNRIITAMAACEPQGFFSKIGTYAATRTGLEVFCANPSQLYPCFEPNAELEGKLSLQVMFLTEKVRGVHGHKRIYYIPQHLSKWSTNLTMQGPIDVFWGTCSPPDPRGFVSLGLSCCYESEIFRAAKIKILEINPNMPVTYGSTVVALDKVDYFVETTDPLPNVVSRQETACETRIAEQIDELIEDGATLQFGIGGIPNAVGKKLTSKKDLGIHTEMIGDVVMTLMKNGTVTNWRKSIWPGKSVGSFVYGSKELYEFVHNNPLIELHPSIVINNPRKMAKNNKMISINTAVEVDLTGQVCSESIGHRELSGVGGAFETHLGAQSSKGGKGIIALTSETKHETSKIVDELHPGAKVSISRNDVDYVVTEYGVAHLRGRSVANRVKSMIAIAHPRHREKLLAMAHKHQYL